MLIVYVTLLFFFNWEHEIRDNKSLEMGILVKCRIGSAVVTYIHKLINDELDNSRNAVCVSQCMYAIG